MEKALLRRALTYPYSIQPKGFAYLSGKAFPLQVTAPDTIKINGKKMDDWLHFKDVTPPREWITILSYGSNQSISQLYKKFPSNVPIFSFPVEITGFDVVRSAHFTSYGTVPATIIPSFGCRTRVALQLLPQDQLAKMHRTEHNGVNYQFVPFPTNRLETPYKSEEVWVYTSLHGPVQLDGSPIAFSEIAASNRTFPDMKQPDFMQHVHQKLLPSADLTQWLTEIVADKVFRGGMTKALKDLG